MSELKYKEGDKLYVEVVVKEVCEHTYFKYLVESDYDEWWVLESDLIAPSSVSPQSNEFHVDVGDVIEDVAGDTYKVHSVDDEYLYFDWGTSHIHKTDVVAVYKPTWKKEKTLEDMTREELIARIKQLEQGE